jgi:uncharacterized protein YqjF (DUF2071 family)
MQGLQNTIGRWLSAVGKWRKDRPEGTNTVRGLVSGDLSYLALLNFEIEQEALFPHVPPGTELDTWQGKTFVSVAGFLFARPRIFGLPLLFQRRFPKVDLRFYVRREAAEGIRRGVAFIRHIVPKRAMASVGRRLRGDAFVALPMAHSVDVSEVSRQAGGSIEYKWYHHGRWNGIHVQIKDGAGFPLSDSEEEFVIERYWGYSAFGDGSCLEYRIEHPKWRLWQSSAAAFSCDDATVYGESLGACLIRSPSSAFVSEGSAVTLYGGNPIGT